VECNASNVESSRRSLPLALAFCYSQNCTHGPGWMIPTPRTIEEDLEYQDLSPLLIPSWLPYPKASASSCRCVVPSYGVLCVDRKQRVVLCSARRVVDAAKHRGPGRRQTMIDGELMKKVKNDALRQHLTATRAHIAGHLQQAKALQASAGG